MALMPIQKLRRKVFLIKGFSKNEQELKNDRMYIDYYKSFFKCIAGGAYNEEEIEILGDISVEDLQSSFARESYDFVVIILLGHGATQEDFQIFKLNDVDIIKPGQIEINSNKQLIVLESCRSIVSKIPTIDLSNKVPDYKEGGKVCIPITRQKARKLYDKQIKICPDGKVICFACSKNETAKEYYFSNILMRYAFNWHLDWRNSNLTLNITELMKKVPTYVNCIATKETKEEQNPAILGSIDFPFAVSKF